MELFRGLTRQCLLRGHSCPSALHILTIRAEEPRRWIVRVRVENRVETPAMAFVRHGRQELDATPEIARPEIGGPDVVRRIAIVREPVDARMLEKAPHDRPHANSLRASGHSGREGADTTHHEIDLDAVLRRAIE